MIGKTLAFYFLLASIIAIAPVAAQEVHDVAVVDIIVPSNVYDVDPDVYVVIENQGSVEETVAVILRDLTSNDLIGNITVTPEEFNGSFAYVGFPLDFWLECIIDWMPGNYLLEATAEPVSGEVDLADNSMTTVLTIPGPTIPDGVDGVISSLITDKASYQKRETVYTTAVVENTGNATLDDAVVQFSYLNPDGAYKYTESKTISLGVGESASVSSSYYLPRKGTPEGTWTVEARLFYDYGSLLLDTKTTNFEVVSKGGGSKGKGGKK